MKSGKGNWEYTGSHAIRKLKFFTRKFSICWAQIKLLVFSFHIRSFCPESGWLPCLNWSNSVNFHSWGGERSSIHRTGTLEEEFEKPELRASLWKIGQLWLNSIYVCTQGRSQKRHLRQEKTHIGMVTNPQNDSFVYLELWATLKILGRMKTPRESFPFLNAVPSAGHLCLGALHTAGTPYLSEDLWTERICELRCLMEARHHPTPSRRNYNPPGYHARREKADMYPLSPGTTKERTPGVFSCFHGFLFLCNRPSCITYCCCNKGPQT